MTGATSQLRLTQLALPDAAESVLSRARAAGHAAAALVGGVEGGAPRIVVDA